MQSNGNRTTSLNEDISTTDNTDVILFVKFILFYVKMLVLIYYLLLLEYWWISNGHRY